jgi:muramoyltetrapeptide carboxypeptidase
MKIPANLDSGDLVAIIPPAKAIDPQHIKNAVKLLESWNLRVVLSDNIHSRYYQFAGTDPVRLKAFQELLDSNEIKCIFCARGGYGTTRILDSLNFDRFQDSPKWIVGYSDITALLLRLYKLGISGIHGPMPINFFESGSEDSLIRIKNLLFKGSVEPVIFTSNPDNIPGQASGYLMGGNLTMIVNCIGTSEDFSTDNHLLFLEDTDEYLYRIDRMLVQLKRSGKLKNLSGLIIGQFTRMQDNEEPFGANIQEIVLELTKEYDYPVCFNAPLGHEMPNFPLPLGGNFYLGVGMDRVVLKKSE